MTAIHAADPSEVNSLKEQTNAKFVLCVPEAEQIHSPVCLRIRTSLLALTHWTMYVRNHEIRDTIVLMKISTDLSEKRWYNMISHNYLKLL